MKKLTIGWDQESPLNLSIQPPVPKSPELQPTKESQRVDIPRLKRDLINILNYTLQVPRRTYFGMLADFDNHYIKSVLNHDINQQVIIPNLSWAFNWQDFITRTGLSSSTSEQNKGIAIHYLVEEDNINYGFSLGERVDNNVCFKPFDNNKYLKIDSSAPSGLSEVEGPAFMTMKDAYLNNMNIASDIGQIDSIQDIQDHPRYTFHSFARLNEFHLHNTFDAVVPTSLFIVHGATYHEGLSERYRFHVPLLRWRDQNGNEIPINNQPYTGTPFRNKACDVGHLCPPDCASSGPGCPEV